jgi:cytochrome c oxidase subunit IV
MSAQTHAVHIEPNYMKVFWWLLALTIVEVGIVYLSLPRWSLVTALVVMAFGKAFLVAWNYMHLRFERWTLIIVPLLALILIADLLLGLLPDIAKFKY